MTVQNQVYTLNDNIEGIKKHCLQSYNETITFKTLLELDIALSPLKMNPPKIDDYDPVLNYANYELYLECFEKMKTLNIKIPVQVFDDLAMSWSMWRGDLNYIIYNTLNAYHIFEYSFDDYDLFQKSLYRFYVDLHSIYDSDEINRMLTNRKFNYRFIEKKYSEEIMQMPKGRIPCTENLLKLRWDGAHVSYDQVKKVKSDITIAKSRIDDFYLNLYPSIECRKNYTIIITIAKNKDEYREMIVKYDLINRGVSGLVYSGGLGRKIYMCVHGDYFDLPNTETDIHEFSHVLDIMYQKHSVLTEGVARFLQHAPGECLVESSLEIPRHFDFNQVRMNCASIVCRYTWTSMFIFYMYTHHKYDLAQILENNNYPINVNSDEVVRFMLDYQKKCTRSTSSSVSLQMSDKSIMEFYYPTRHANSVCADGEIYVVTNNTYTGQKYTMRMDASTGSILDEYNHVMNTRQFYVDILSYASKFFPLGESKYTSDSMVVCRRNGAEERPVPSSTFRDMYNKIEFAKDYDKMKSFNATFFGSLLSARKSSVDFVRLIEDLNMVRRHGAGAKSVCDAIRTYIFSKKSAKFFNFNTELISAITPRGDNIFHYLAIYRISVDMKPEFCTIYRKTNKLNHTPLDYGLVLSRYKTGYHYCDAFKYYKNMTKLNITTTTEASTSAASTTTDTTATTTRHTPTSTKRHHKAAVSSLAKKIIRYKNVAKTHVVRVSKNNHLYYDFVKILNFNQTITFKLRVNLNKLKDKRITFEITI